MIDHERVGFREIQAAQSRVGRTPQSRLQWALDFMRRELDQFSDAAWSSLQREFLAFSDVVIPPSAVHSEWIKRMLASEAWGALWMKRGGRRGPGRPSVRAAHLELGPVVKLGDPAARVLPTRVALRDLQAQWRRFVDELSSKHAVSIGPFTVMLQVSRRHGHAEAMPVALGTDKSALLALANLLGAYAHLIRECEEPTCRRRFVSTRRGQKFCNRTCQSKAAVAAYQARRRAGGAPKRRRP